jgi:hypothetical protein
MFSRIALLAITVFWVTMNYLLWRSEFGRTNHEGSRVPVAVVWKKILSAPDSSTLEIRHHGKKIGDCSLSSKISEDLSAATLDPTAPPTPDAKAKSSSYRIHLDGSIALEGMASRLRFDCYLKLNTNQTWQEFGARMTLRPDVWELRAVAGEQAIHLRSDDEQGKSERVVKLADLQDPEAILRELDAPASLKFLGLSGLLSASGKGGTPMSLGLAWEAHDDRFEISHTSVRVYRLKAKLLDRFGIVVVVNRVGEVLRVELPDEWVLASDPLSTM